MTHVSTNLSWVHRTLSDVLRHLRLAWAQLLLVHNDKYGEFQRLPPFPSIFTEVISGRERKQLRSLYLKPPPTPTTNFASNSRENPS
jgi:hypothetical protein